MHPYRTAPPVVDAQDSDEGGLRLALGVLAVLGAVQLASGVVAAAPLSLESAFGGACFVAGLAGLVRHRRR